jgi:putative transposase
LLTGEFTIKKQFSNEEIFAALTRARAGQRLASLAADIQVCEHTIYEWKKKYGGMSFKQLQTFRNLERENRAIKKTAKDQARQIKILHFIIRVTAPLNNDRAQNLIRQIQSRFPISNRSVIRYLGLNRSTFFYRNRKNIHDLNTEH